jgi:hypothetical protein
VGLAASAIDIEGTAVVIPVVMHGSAVLIYGYASVVRNDTGDAIFIFGTSPNNWPPSERCGCARWSDGSARRTVW